MEQTADAGGSGSSAGDARINASGELEGSYDDEDGRHGYVWSKGVFTRLDAPRADGFTVAQGVNDAGRVVGQFTDADGNGFVPNKGVYTTIDVLGPLSQSAVFSVNAQGRVVGQFDDADGVTCDYVGEPVR